MLFSVTGKQMIALVSLTHSKILRYLQKCWRLENLHTCRSRCVKYRKNLNTQNFLS